jgi:hypothetical protein
MAKPNNNINYKLKFAKKKQVIKLQYLQLSQAGTVKNPLQNRLPDITDLLQLD